MFTYVFVCAVGLVSAGLIVNAWPLLTGDQVSVLLFEKRDPLLPLRALIVVVAMPILLIQATFARLSEPSESVFKWWLTLPSAAGWAFVQGVVIVAGFGGLA